MKYNRILSSLTKHNISFLEYISYDDNNNEVKTIKAGIHTLWFINDMLDSCANY